MSYTITLRKEDRINDLLLNLKNKDDKIQAVIYPRRFEVIFKIQENGDASKKKK